MFRLLSTTCKTFSNSLIIHQVKKKKKQNRNREGISLDFSFNSLVLFLEKKQCFISYPNTSNFLKYSGAARRISNTLLFSRCLDIHMKHCFSFLIYFFQIQAQTESTQNVWQKDEGLHRHHILVLLFL